MQAAIVICVKGLPPFAAASASWGRRAPPFRGAGEEELIEGYAPDELTIRG